MPTAPTHGGIVQIDATTHALWVGGKPKADWSGLDPSALTEPVAPTQFRPQGISSAAKGHSLRERGLDIKFSRASDLENLEHQVWRHLVNHGLDTITYVPDPVDNNIMVNCVKEHGRFSVDSIKRLVKGQLTMYDKYDRANDREATQFLLDSLDLELQKELRASIDDSDCFPLVFLRLIKNIRSISIDRFEHLKTRIKTCKPHQFAGQDLSKMSLDLQASARELSIAGQYDHNLTLHMLESFLEAGGPNNEDFRFELRGLKQKLSAELLVIGYKTAYDADRHMVQSGLTYKDICETAVNEYRKQFDNSKWPPARSVGIDTKAPPKAFGNVATSTCGVDPAAVAQAFALYQQQNTPGGKAKSSDICLSCGDKGHWARECPKKGSQGFQPRKITKPQNNRGPSPKPLRSDSTIQLSGWKRTPPASGESQIKHVKGKRFRWCEKCARWSTTHDSASHTGPNRKVQANLVFDSPSAWHISFVASSSLLDLLWEILSFVLLLLNRNVFRMFCAAGVGYTLAFLPSGFWSYALALLLARWTNLVAPTCWVLAFLLCTFGHPVLCWLRVPPDPSARVKLNSTKWKILRRRHRNSRHFRRRIHHRRPPHHSLQKRCARRILARQTQLFDALSALHCFAKSITFRRVRRGGDNRSNKVRHHRQNRHKCNNQKFSTYRPTAGRGICKSQWDILATPAAKAFFMNGPLPAPLRDATQALRAAFLTLPETNNQIGKEHRFGVIWDSGASISISPNKSDFVGPLEPAPIGIKLQGIAKGLYVQGTGYVVWSFVDTTGMLRTLKLPAYFVPGAKTRLLSTNSLLQTYSTENIHQDANRLCLSGDHSKNLSPIEILIDPASNLPVGYAYDHSVPQTTHAALSAIITTTRAANMNLSTTEKELMHWHHRLGHLGYRKIQFLMRTGVLAHSESARRNQSAAAKLVHCPLCAACQYGKQRRKPSPGKRSMVVSDNVGALKRDHLFPGQRVSVDHFVCSTRGRLLNTYGKEDPKEQFSGGAIFVDHSSGFIVVAPQIHLNTHETLNSKIAFENLCRDYGIIVSGYQSDNGSTFTSQAYQDHLRKFAQIQSFAGVGAHHHNGVAERSIQTVMSISRTMMLHAAIHWPDAANATLWPLAVAHATRLYNHVPDPATGLSPHDLFTKIRWPQSKLKDIHVWGCPVYVLDKTISDGKKLPRWKPRSTRQIYVGMSEKHASSVPLCLNLDTGAITVQFHVVFDDNFATVASSLDALPDFDSPAWHELFGTSVYQYVFDETDDSEEHNDMPVSPASPAIQDRHNRVLSATELHVPALPLPVTPPATASPSGVLSPQPPNHKPGPTLRTFPQQETRQTTPTLDVSSPPATTQIPISTKPASDPSAHVESHKQGEQEVVTQQKQPQGPILSRELRRLASHNSPGITEIQPSTVQRQRRPPTRFSNSAFANFVASLDSDVDLQESMNLSLLTPIDLEQAPPLLTPSAFKARALKDPDTLSWDEAMKSPHQAKWLEAAQIEISALEKKHTWVEVPMSDARSKIIPGTWVFRVKRTPDGEIKKFKGRYCVRGDLEEPDGTDTFSPVVSWSTVRLFLILSIMLEWKTVSIDFSNAFVQSKLDKPVWIHIPRGYRSSQGPGTCLRLRKSLYGLSVAPKLWCNLCINGFKKLGFVQSTIDPCLLYRPGMMIVLWVDDAGIASKDPTAIDKLIRDLRELGFELTQEESFSEFLGIQYNERADGSIELTQKGLIKKILQATNMEDCKPNWTPATAPLGTNPDEPPMHESWNYLSIVGMLLYLATNTRPDIAFAVSQVARFSAAPKQIHATAVKTIIRYLKRTAEQGTIIRPSKGSNMMDFDLWVDADFCGLFRYEVDANPDSAKSRTGLVVTLGGAPVTCKSLLQQALSCSTLEAEYQALSYALKIFIPMKRMLVELLSGLRLNVNAVIPTVRASVFEDNQGAFYLATNNRITNRTRYFLNKWHWFWSLVGKEFDIVKIESRNQRADYFTKPLPRETFEHNRYLLQGW